jgi:hypothetical protein
VKPVHDALRNLERGTPLWFTISGWLVPAGVLAQFLLAGLAQFGGGDFSTHAMFGSLLALPVLVLLLGALSVGRLRGFGWWAGVARHSLPHHPVNGALVLVASLILRAKIERRRAHARATRDLGSERTD